jgi:hypothetical protein
MGVLTPTHGFWRSPRMRVHRNAKTTPRMRRLMIDRVWRLGWTQARTAEAAGVSVRTVAKGCARDRQGDVSLLDGASRPHRQPRRLAPAVTDQIVQLRHTRATAWQISTALRVPRSTVTRVLHRVGLGRLQAACSRTMAAPIARTSLLAPLACGACAIASPGPIGHRPTARPNASFRRSSGSGRIVGRTRAPPSAPRRWRASCGSTITSVPMRVSGVDRPGPASRLPPE